MSDDKRFTFKVVVDGRTLETPVEVGVGPFFAFKAADTDLYSWIEQVHAQAKPREPHTFDLVLRADDREPGIYDDGIVGVLDGRKVSITRDDGERQDGDTILQGCWISDFKFV